MDVVLKLRELRRLSGLTQKEVAVSSGVNEKTISSFESAQRIGSMKLSQLLQLLTVYDVTPAEFFGNGVERRLVGELADIEPTELRLIAAWRSVPEPVRPTVLERLLLMIDNASVPSAPLRAVR